MILDFSGIDRSTFQGHRSKDGQEIYTDYAVQMVTDVHLVTFYLIVPENGIWQYWQGISEPDESNFGSNPHRSVIDVRYTSTAYDMSNYGVPIRLR